MYPLASTCGSSRSSDTDCTGAQGASSPGENRFPLVEVPFGELVVELGHTRFAILTPGHDVGKAGVFGEVGTTDDVAELGPVSIRLEKHELDVAIVFRSVDADKRIHHRASATRAAFGSSPLRAARRSDESVHIAVARRDTSTSEPAPVRVRFNNAAATPKASASAPFRSPKAPRWPIG